jgi:hypothetical protein
MSALTGLQKHWELCVALYSLFLLFAARPIELLDGAFSMWLCHSVASATHTGTCIRFHTLLIKC